MVPAAVFIKLLFDRCLRCTPYTAATDDRWVQLGAALEEFERMLIYVRRRRPLYVVVETVSALLHRSNRLAFERWERALTSIAGYQWSGVVLCPSLHASPPRPRRRRRLFIYGYLVGV